MSNLPPLSTLPDDLSDILAPPAPAPAEIVDLDLVRLVRWAQGRGKWPLLATTSGSPPTAPAWSTVPPYGIDASLALSALWYAMHGVPVFPCTPDSKEPAVAGGFHAATTDPVQIAAWWQQWPEANIALCPADAGWCVVDLDPGSAEVWKALLAEHGPIADTFTVETPRGGLHLYFRGSLPSTVGKLAPHVDTRGVGGYVLAPPSGVNGKPYTVLHDRDLAEVPAWIAPLLASKVSATAAPAGTVLDTPSAIARATSLLRAMVARGDAAIEGRGGNNRTYQVAAELHDLGLSEDGAVRLLLAEWNEHCRPPWDAGDLATIVGNANRYGQNEPGAWAVGTAADSFGKAPVVQDAIRESAAAKVGPGGTDSSADYPPPLTMRDLVARDFPVPTFAVQDMILARTLNMMWGDGGTGKTSLCLHLAVAVAAGVPVFGLAVRQMPVLLVLKEDDYGPTKQRLAAICARLFHVALDDLPIALSCLPASDLTLAAIDDRGQDSVGPFLKPLAGFVRAMGDGDKLVILDPVGDFAALDENRRAPVNTFCKDVIGATLCSGLGATVLVTGHPSKTGMADGSGYGGTTAWKNSVRAMTVFKRTNMEDLTDPARVWTMQKGNYGPPRTLDLTAEFPAANEVLFRHDSGKGDGDLLRVVAEAAIMAYEAGVAIVRNRGIPEMVSMWIKRRANVSMRPKQIRERLVECFQADLLRYQGAPTGSQPGRGATPRAGWRAFNRIEDKPYSQMLPQEERAHSAGR